MSALLRQRRLPAILASLLLSYLLADTLFTDALPAAAALSGLAAAAAAAALAVQQRISIAPAALLVTAGLALALSGFTEHQLHTGLRTMFTVLGATAVFLIGTGTNVTAPVRIVLTAAGLVALTAFFGRVGGYTGLEVLECYPVLGSVILLSWWHPRAETVPAQSSDEVSV